MLCMREKKGQRPSEMEEKENASKRTVTMTYQDFLAELDKGADTTDSVTIDEQPLDPNITETQDALFTEPQNAVGTETLNTVRTEPQDTDRTEALDTVSTEPQDAVGMEPQDTLCTVSTEALAHDEGEEISPSASSTKLALYHKFVDNLRSLPKTERKSILNKLTSEDQLKKVRGASVLAHDLKMDRRHLVSGNPSRMTARQKFYKIAETEIVEFLKRPENSITLPGKKDVITIKKKKHQKIQLVEFLHILHQKYNEQFPTKMVSFAYFAKVRQMHQYILPVACHNPKVCLCVKHQNFTLKLKCVRGLGLPQLPDGLVQNWRKDQVQETLEREEVPASFKYQIWKRVDVHYGDNQVTKKLRLVEVEEEKDAFVKNFMADMVLMTSHVERMFLQYTACRKLKDDMPPDHCMVQMDFAENWLISYPDEPQSVYFAKEPVTVHPTIIHFKNNSGIKHQSIVFVSDERKHDSASVFAFLKMLISFIKQEHPNIHFVHYVTDGPTSQYRNAACMSIVAKHQELFNLEATWLYFEAGYGKGACDGVGAAAKRMADSAVKRDVLIQNASDFAKTGNDSGSQVKYMHVPRENINLARDELGNFAYKKAVPGTMRAHAVTSPSVGTVAIRPTSCYQTCCFQNSHWVLGCEGWVIHHLFPVNESSDSRRTEVHDEEVEEGEEADEVQHDISHDISPQKGEWVACAYERNWYLGQVEDILEDNEFLVNFLYKATVSNKFMNQFKWPKAKDELAIPRSDIIATNCALQSYGSSHRKWYVLPEE